jgi:hypothetical protein
VNADSTRKCGVQARRISRRNPHRDFSAPLNAQPAHHCASNIGARTKWRSTTHTGTLILPSKSARCSTGLQDGASALPKVERMTRKNQFRRSGGVRGWTNLIAGGMHSALGRRILLYHQHHPPSQASTLCLGTSFDPRSCNSSTTHSSSFAFSSLEPRRRPTLRGARLVLFTATRNKLGDISSAERAVKA